MLEGELAREIGRGTQALACFERACAFAQDDKEKCAAWIGIAMVHRLTSDVQAGFAALAAAETLAAAHDETRELAHIHYLRGGLLFTAGDVDACRGEHELALKFAQQSGDLEREAQAQSGLADAFYAQGRMRSARAAFSRCVEICERGGFARFAIMNRCMLAVIEHYFGESTAAIASLEETRATAHKVKHLAAEAMAEECIGWILTNCGRYAEARGPLDHGLALSRDIGMRRFETVCMICLAHVLCAEGSKDEARQLAHAAWKLCQQFSPRFAGPSALGTIARLARSEDERSEALAAAESLLAQGCVGHSALQFYVSAIDMALEHRQWAEAERYANALEDYAKEEPLPWTDFFTARGRALAAAGRGFADRDALESLRRAALRFGYAAAVPALEAALMACHSTATAGPSLRSG